MRFMAESKPCSVKNNWRENRQRKKGGDEERWRNNEKVIVTDAQIKEGKRKGREKRGRREEGMKGSKEGRTLKRYEKEKSKEYKENEMEEARSNEKGREENGMK